MSPSSLTESKTQSNPDCVNSTQALINSLVADPLTASSTLTEYDASQPQLSSCQPVKGVILPGLLLATLNNQGKDNNAGPNAEVVYYSIYFPNVSQHELYGSFAMQYNDIITVTAKQPLSMSVAQYIDLNIYYRGVQGPTSGTFENIYDGTITETVSAYQFSINLPNLVYGCSQSAIKAAVGNLCRPSPNGNTGPAVIRTVPKDWINPNGPTLKPERIPEGTNLTNFLFRIQTGSVLAAAEVINPDFTSYFNFNDYYEVTYYRALTKTGPYYSLANPAPNSYYFFPLKVNYPINTAARVQYQSVVSLFELNPLNTKQVTEPYFSSFSTPPGTPIDCAYRCIEYNFDIVFDNRANTYFTTPYFVVLPGSQVVVVQYNHKKEPGRCQYSSISIYGVIGGNSLAQLTAVTTIPVNQTPLTDSLIVVYTNTAPTPVFTAVVERIYQYPASAYDNAQPMTVFVRLTSP